MPGYTTLLNHELNNPTGNEQVDSIIKGIRQHSGTDYQITKRMDYPPGICWPWVKPREVWTLYVHEPNASVFEWRVVNCGCTEEAVAAYIYGVGTGLNIAAGRDVVTPKEED